MFRRVAVRLEELTPELARKFSEMPHLDGERRRKPRRLADILKWIKDGEFAGPTWSVATLKGDAEAIQYRANGQHTSYVLSRLPADVPFPDGLMVAIEIYELDSLEEDAEKLFNIFDNPASVRSNVDVCGLYLAHYSELADISPEFVQMICNGINLYRASIKDGLTHAARQRGLHLVDAENRRFVVWATGFRTYEHHHFLGRSGITAEMYADWLADEALATEFWTYVINESHPDKDDITRKLVRTLNALSDRPKIKPDAYRKHAHRTWTQYGGLANSRADHQGSEAQAPA
jgi:hypothetical protein